MLTKEQKEHKKHQKEVDQQLSEADARVQVIFADEVKRIHAEITRLADETIVEGRLNKYTAEQALGIFHSKCKKMLGPWS